MNSSTPIRPPRILYYSHDSFGLGHLRRTLALAAALERRAPGCRQLVASGSPVARQLIGRGRIGLASLPPVVKVGPDRYRPLGSSSTIEEQLRRRADRLLAAARRFHPDVVVIDHAPLGLQGEALPLLRELRRRWPRTRVILGLRDVIDSPDLIRSQWQARGIYQAIVELYDQVLIYGDPSVFETAREYDLPPRMPARYLGYLGRPGPARGVELAGRPSRRRELLVTAGGGGDGLPLFETALGLLADRRLPADLRLHLVLGPLLGADSRRQLHERASGEPRVRITDFAQGMDPHWSTASAVVTMGGYNSLTEILSRRLPAVVVPRTEPRREQLIRARALERHLAGRLRVLPPEGLDVGSLADAVAALPTGRGPRPAVDLAGLGRFAHGVMGLASEAQRSPLTPARSGLLPSRS